MPKYSYADWEQHLVANKQTIASYIKFFDEHQFLSLTISSTTSEIRELKFILPPKATLGNVKPKKFPTGRKKNEDEDD